MSLVADRHRSPADERFEDRHHRRPPLFSLQQTASTALRFMVTPELIAPQTVEEPLDALERHMASFLGAKVFSSLPVILFVIGQVRDSFAISHLHKMLRATPITNRTTCSNPLRSTHSVSALVLGLP